MKRLANQLFLTLLGLLIAFGSAESYAYSVKVSSAHFKQYVQVSPSSLAFSSQAVNTSSTKTITVLNYRYLPLAISGITVTGPFTQTNTCGTTLAAYASCKVTVTFTPTAAGSQTGKLTISDNAVGSPQAVSLSGTATGAASVTLSASTLSFSSQAINTSSSAMPVTLTNSGSAALSVSSIGVTGNFAQTNNCGASVAAGASCTISVTFKPLSVGSLSGTLSIADSATGSPHKVNLLGTGAGSAAVSLSASSLSFTSTTVNSTSAVQTVTLTNSGSAALSISSIGVTGNFAQTNTCGTSVAAGASCAISVTFKPLSVGSLSGTLSIADSATGSPHTVSLLGIGAGSAAVSLSASSLSFTSTTVNTTSAAQTVTLTNSGSAALSISSIGVTGNFAQTNNCGASVAAGASCAISVTFKPLSVGSLSGTLSIADNATGSPHTVVLSGTGAGTASVTLSPSSLTFASQTVGKTSSAMTVTLTNNGSAALTVSSVSVTGNFTQTNTCGSSVAAGTSCTISVTFTPASSGSLSGTLSIADSATGSPHTAALYGTGVTAGSLSSSPSSIAFGSVTVNQSSTQSVTVTNNGGTGVTISSVSTSGSGVQVSGLSMPLTLAANGGSATFLVTFTPSSASSVSGAVYLANNGTVTNFSIPVTGTGAGAASASLSPSALSFSSTVPYNTSAAQNVTLKNNGSATLTISSIATTGSFAQTNNCGSSLSAGGSCTIAVTFTPTASGSQSGTLSVADNATGSPQSISLSGTGGHLVQLSWSASSGSVTGYNTYRSTVSGGPYTKMTSTPSSSTSYTDTTVQAGLTYFYVVTAVGTNAAESSYSPQAVAVVPQ